MLKSQYLQAVGSFVLCGYKCERSSHRGAVARGRTVRQFSSAPHMLHHGGG